MEKSKKNKAKKISSFDLRLARIGIEDEKEYLLENLAMLIRAGIGISAAFQSIRESTRSRGMKILLAMVQEDLDDGQPLWRALERSGLFAPSIISLVRLGEESGQLRENLSIIILRQKKERTFRSKIFSAMMYPVFVLALAFFIGTGIAWFILPRLAKVFSEMDIALPLVTRILIASGKFIEQYGAIAVPIFIAVVCLLFYFLFFHSRTKFVGERILFRIPGINRLVQSVELSRFGSIVGNLMQAGIPMRNALASLQGVGGFQMYQVFYQQLAEDIESGYSFQQSFARQKGIGRLVPLPQQQMVVAAEQSGQLTETLIEIGAIYEEKTENITKNIATILEPVLLVIVWLAVVFIALAVILPIYSLVGGFNSGTANNAAPIVQEEVSAPAPTEEIGTVETVSVQEKGQPEKVPNIEILETEVGYLNVRKAPTPKGELIEVVAPGEKYFSDQQEDGWYAIELVDGSIGWVMGTYVKALPADLISE